MMLPVDESRCTERRTIEARRDFKDAPYLTKAEAWRLRQVLGLIGLAPTTEYAVLISLEHPVAGLIHSPVCQYDNIAASRIIVNGYCPCQEAGSGAICKGPITAEDPPTVYNKLWQSYCGSVCG